MIEVLVTVAILAIVVTPCLSAFVMAQRGNVKAAETKQAYTAAANLMEELKGDADKRSEVLTEGDLGKKWVDSEKKITVLYAMTTYGADKTYYTVTIYAGDYSQTDVPEGVEPILKGVIAP
jgi:type II secretory pathway pseudopilin PulG